MELTPIRVEIRLTETGQHKFPDFNGGLAAEVRDNMDWCNFVDKFGGWYYDKSFGHADDGTDVDGVLNSPPGTWLGMLLVPDDFAQAAIAAFPEVTELTPLQAKVFYEQRVTATQPEIFDDKDELASIAARKSAGVADDADVTNALDPDKPHRGRRRNKTKTLAGLRQTKNITFNKPE